MNAFHECDVCGTDTEGFCSLCFADICSEACEEKHYYERIARCDKLAVPVDRSTDVQFPRKPRILMRIDERPPYHHR